jgi:hypothetical protein
MHTFIVRRVLKRVWVSLTVVAIALGTRVSRPAMAGVLPSGVVKIMNAHSGSLPEEAGASTSRLGSSPVTRTRRRYKT